MVEVSIERELEFGAETVWALIADFGDLRWVPGIEKIELEGDRCRVRWSCRADADGADEEQAAAKVGAFYESMLTWIDDFLKR